MRPLRQARQPLVLAAGSYSSINAAAESFWSTLKTEFYNRRDWPTKAEAKQAVGAWIEERYNRRRRHSSIGMITPVRFEELHPQTARAA